MIEDLEVSLVSILWYLYRSAGCPMGESLQGLYLWMKTSVIAPFEELAEVEEGAWCAASMTCQHCGHTWAAAYPASAESLECPQCHEHTEVNP